MTHLLRADSEEGGTHVFQLIDVKIMQKIPDSFDYNHFSEIHADKFMSHANSSEPTYTNECVVGLFGCTEKGNSVFIKVSGFQPYLFYKKQSSATALKEKLANLLNLDDSDVLRHEEVNLKNAYGWEPNRMEHPTDRKEHIYFKIYFPNVSLMRKAIQKTKCHEGQIGPDSKFMDQINLVPSGWVRVNGTRIIEDKISHCPIELECNMRDLTPIPEKIEIAPLVVACIDIECISETGGFPDADNFDDKIYQIGAVFWRIGTPAQAAVKCIFVVGECDPIEGAHVYTYRTERELLSGFRTHLVAIVDPDIVATYNGFGFDLEYLWKRAKMLKCCDFCYLDRLVMQKSHAENKELTSSALGSNELFIINMVGRSNLDIFQWIKAREKLESYKLDDVAEHFLGEKKVDMDYKEMFKLCKGSSKDVSKVAIYCIQDCYLLVLLVLRLSIFAANVEMSRVCFTPMEALVTRGQQYKVMNQLLHYGHEEGYILNTPEKYSGSENDSYEGATVIDAKAKYYKKPVAVLDFMSLYPSIMLANNFCFSTLVLDERYMKIPGVQYETIQVTEKKVYTWAKGMKGLLPIMLEKLLAARKTAKKAMANAKSDEEKSVLNGRQLALKISANSIYGFTGAVKMGKYHCLAVADSTTYKAREMLHQTVVWVKEFAPCDVVYGDTDSVMVLFENANTVEEAFELGDEASEVITNKFSEKYNTTKIVLEMEKVYFPYLLMRKKRYAGLMYEKNKNGEIYMDHLDAKGIELIRRDNCALAKRVQSDVLDALMYKMDEELACKAVHKHMEGVVNNEFPLSDYKMSKSRRKDYKNEELPHLKVVEKMRARNPGSEPQVGDRVPFILIETKDLKAKACEKSEDPKYIEEHNLKVDRLYYTEHQIVNPVCGLLDLVIDTPENLFTDHIRKLKQQRTNQSSILGFMKRLSPPTEEKPIKIQKKEDTSFEDAMMNIRPSQPLKKKPVKKRK